MKIHLCMMTQSELTDLVPNIEQLLPHVDTVNIVDGGSADLTIQFMRNWSQDEPKIRFFLHPWKDNFPAQRNNYLKRVAEVATLGDWLVCVDPDELLEEEAVKNLRNLAETADKAGCNLVGFRCHGVSLKGPKEVWRSEDNYWKRFLIKWTPNFRYIHAGEGPVHEGYGGIQHNIMDTGKHPACKTTYWYEHRKQQNITWSRGMRNHFCGGGGPNLGSKNHRWVELRQITDSLGIRDWHSFWKYLVAGNIDQKVKDWMIKYRQENNWDGASEVRENYKTYYRVLHPEEEPTELRGEHIP